MIIYKITDYINGKIYIGQTINTLEKRWKGHCKLSKKDEQPYFHNSIHSHGKYNFFREVIDFATSMHELNYLEEFWIEFYNSTNRDKGYNSLSVGKNFRHSEESKEKNRIAHLGFKASPEHIQIIKNVNKGNKHRLGIPHSKESLEKQMIKKLNRLPSDGRKFKGICQHKSGKYSAKIKINNKTKYLGMFSTDIKAAQAYNDAVDKYRNGHGYKNII